MNRHLTRKMRNSGWMLVSLPVLAVVAACSHKLLNDQQTASTSSQADRRIAWEYVHRYGGPPNVDPATGRALTDSEIVGRDVWYKASAGNSRYNTYTFPQRLMSANIRWTTFLGTEVRDKRFDRFGLINDPDCRAPKAGEETYGFDFCPGDEDLLDHVGKTGYRDPGCDYKVGDSTHACDLDMGTSTGVVGFRKLPNPRFDKVEWEKADTQGRKGWAKFNANVGDASLEPPFRIGIACASCHVSLLPSKPPADPNHPGWENISFTVGNQYIRNATLMGSGAPHDSIEWQLFRFDRPGTADTSAAPHDQLYNPGTMNSIINIPRRPRFSEVVTTSRAPSWERSTQRQDDVMHILKGGEDSIGPAGAVQRVYINIGSCSEQCWLNHLMDLRVVDSTQRGYDQTPFDIDQCRKDCKGFGAIEERVGDVFAFLNTARPTDLKQAVQNEAVDDGKTVPPARFEKWVEKRFNGSISRGRELFKTAGCISCHSSPGMEDMADFDKAQAEYSYKDTSGAVVGTESLRANWFGNDQLTPVNDPRVNTYACRALHSNHMKGHVWEQYASDTYRERANPHSGAKWSGEGRGYMRNISLLNAWAYAPFLHNNALGPEICNREQGDALYSSPFRNDKDVEIEGSPKCVPFPYKVSERLDVFEQSVRELFKKDLTDGAFDPAVNRVPKISRMDNDLVFPLPPVFKWKQILSGKNPLKTPRLIIPKGTPSALVGNFKLKEFIWDMMQYLKSPSDFAAYMKKSDRGFSDADIESLRKDFDETKAAFLSGNDVVADQGRLRRYTVMYATCPATPENVGHFVDLEKLGFTGEAKDQAERDLISFLSTI